MKLLRFILGFASQQRYIYIYIFSKIFFKFRENISLFLVINHIPPPHKNGKYIHLYCVKDPFPVDPDPRILTLFLIFFHEKNALLFMCVKQNYYLFFFQNRYFCWFLCKFPLIFANCFPEGRNETDPQHCPCIILWWRFLIFQIQIRSDRSIHIKGEILTSKEFLRKSERRINLILKWVNLIHLKTYMYVKLRFYNKKKCVGRFRRRCLLFLWIEIYTSKSLMFSIQGVQGDQINMAVLFWYLFKRYQKIRPCLTGQARYRS